MIKSADEFAQLRVSDDLNEQARAGHEPAEDGVWLDVIARYPALKTWVAYNKTIPLDILRLLAVDPDPQVRRAVAMKRKLDIKLFETLAHDADEIVRRRIFYNAKCPEDLRGKISLDSND